MCACHSVHIIYYYTYYMKKGGSSKQGRSWELRRPRKMTFRGLPSSHLLPKYLNINKTYFYNYNFFFFDFAITKK